ncbi:hypothetical protein G7Y79_00072g097750 [Physcia stellaris]|nr:hypothetical protein G7Y79_00072g097750 [Physcia stellaris]
MYTTQITAIALTAFAALLQPCPAPFVGDLIHGVLGGGQKRSDITSNLDTCIQNFRAATEHVQIIGEQTVVLEGVPAACMAEAKAWIEHPHAQSLAKDYGSVKILNATAIQLDGLPRKTQDLIQQAMTPQ